VNENSNRETSCPKCGSAFEAGYLLDRSLHVTAACWVAGDPPESFLAKRSADEGHGPRIRALRCAECGFVELYATGPTD